MDQNLQLPALRQYLRNMNVWSELRNQPKYKVFSLTQAQAKQVAARIEADLSPENLSCDGELSVDERRRRYAKMMAVKRELGQLIELKGWKPR